MSFMPVILWSDALVFLLLAAGIASAWDVRRPEHLRPPWRGAGEVVWGALVGAASGLMGGVFIIVSVALLFHMQGTNGANPPQSPLIRGEAMAPPLTRGGWGGGWRHPTLSAP